MLEEGKGEVEDKEEIPEGGKTMTRMSAKYIQQLMMDVFKEKES